jgi:hypothetical protein
MNGLHTLLEKIGAIKSDAPKNPFNIFTTLLSASDEVYVHSKFISFLCTPKANHGFGTEFLDAFLQEIDANLFSEHDRSNVTVEVERSFNLPEKDGGFSGRIDIIITQPKANACLILENKIWAADQPKQLERYFKFAQDHLKIKPRNIHLYYLSPDGQIPHPDSFGELKNTHYIASPRAQSVQEDGKLPLRCISYSVNMSNWMNICLKIAEKNAPIYHALQQYQSTIKTITGKMQQDEYQPVIDFLAQQPNLEIAHKIGSNWAHIRWQTEYAFWEDLEGTLRDKCKDLGSFSILEHHKWSPKALTDEIHGRGNPWYGIMFLFTDLLSFEQLAIYIERGRSQLVLGLTVGAVAEKRISVEDATFEKLRSSENPYWLQCRPIECAEINFGAFSSKDTLSLLNPDSRKPIIDKIVKEVDAYIYEMANTIANT